MGFSHCFHYRLTRPTRRTGPSGRRLTRPPGSTRPSCSSATSSAPVWKSNSESGAQFFTKSFLGDDTAVLAESSGEGTTPPRRRAGVRRWRGGHDSAVKETRRDNFIHALGSTSRVMVLPVRVLTKICILCVRVLVRYACCEKRCVASAGVCG